MNDLAIFYKCFWLKIKFNCIIGKYIKILLYPKWWFLWGFSAIPKNDLGIKQHCKCLV